MCIGVDLTFQLDWWVTWSYWVSSSPQCILTSPHTSLALLGSFKAHISKRAAGSRMPNNELVPTYLKIFNPIFCYRRANRHKQRLFQFWLWSPWQFQITKNNLNIVVDVCNCMFAIRECDVVSWSDPLDQIKEMIESLFSHLQSKQSFIPDSYLENNLS